MIIIFISHLFSPCGRAGGSHMLRYSGRSIVHYSFALKCLAYGSLRLVQNPSLHSEFVFRQSSEEVFAPLRGMKRLIL